MDCLLVSKLQSIIQISPIKIMPYYFHYTTSIVLNGLHVADSVLT